MLNVHLCVIVSWYTRNLLIWTNIASRYCGLLWVLFIIYIRPTDVSALHFNVDTLATGSDALVALRFVIAVKLDCQLTILVFMKVVKLMLKFVH